MICPHCKTEEGEYYYPGQGRLCAGCYDTFADSHFICTYCKTIRPDEEGTVWDGDWYCDSCEPGVL